MEYVKEPPKPNFKEGNDREPYDYTIDGKSFVIQYV